MQQNQGYHSPYGTSGNQEGVELHLSCFGLTNEDSIFGGKSDGQCELYAITQNGQRQKVGETEVKHNDHDPEFHNPIHVEFIFEMRQQYVVVCYDWDDHHEKETIGEALFELSDVMMHQAAGYTVNLMHQGQKRGGVKIRAERLGKENFEWQIDTRMTNVKDLEWTSDTDPFLVFRRPADQFLNCPDPKNIGIWHKVHQTEFIKDQLNPNFRPFGVSANKLNRGMDNAWIEVQLWDNGSKKDQYMGKGYFSVNQLMQAQNKTLPILDNGGRNVGNLIFEKFFKSKRHTLADYMKYGVHLSLVTAFDFTTANGSPGSSSYLHATNGSNYNLYEEALVKVGTILQHYDSDNYIPAYGYGFTAPQVGINQTNYCYPLSGDMNAPHIQGFMKILPLYRQMVTQILPGGPVHMAPILQRAVASTKNSWSQDKSIYTIVLFLCAGNVEDQQETMQAINEARDLPIVF